MLMYATQMKRTLIGLRHVHASSSGKWEIRPVKGDRAADAPGGHSGLYGTRFRREELDADSG